MIKEEFDFERMAFDNQYSCFDSRLGSNKLEHMIKEHHLDKVVSPEEFDGRIESETENYAELFSLKDIVKLFLTDIFDEFSIDEKALINDILRDKIVEDMNINKTPEIIVAFLDDEGLYGYFAPEINAVVVNAFLLNNGPELLKTIAHELRHCWQQERVELPEHEKTPFDKALQDNMENYIQPEDNYRAYRGQLIETDARGYAEGVQEMAYCG